MRMRTVLFTVAAFAAAGTAQGAITTIGGGQARACYQAAKFGRATQPGVDICSRALTEEALTDRDRVATLVNRGIIQMQARSFDAAIRDYDAALRLNPSQAEAHVNKGIALLHRGGEAEAIAALSQGIALNPEQPEIAYYTRGVAHEISGDVTAAYRDYKQAASIRPEWRDPQQQLQRFQVVRKGG